MQTFRSDEFLAKVGLTWSNLTFGSPKFEIRMKSNEFIRDYISGLIIILGRKYVSCRQRYVGIKMQKILNGFKNFLELPPESSIFAKNN